MQERKVNILGTEYLIRKMSYKEEPDFEKRGIDGYCDSYIGLIVYCDLDTDKRWDGETDATKRICERSTLRHEIIHAFLDQSGLRESSSDVNGWARNEEMVDWFAIQSPKIFEVFKELDLL